MHFKKESSQSDWPHWPWTLSPESFTLLEVADNGLGITLDKLGKDLFGMYRRFICRRRERTTSLPDQVAFLEETVEIESPNLMKVRCS